MSDFEIKKKKKKKKKDWEIGKLTVKQERVKFQIIWSKNNLEFVSLSIVHTASMYWLPSY
jgi:hypothetical protein